MRTIIVLLVTLFLLAACTATQEPDVMDQPPPPAETPVVPEPAEEPPQEVAPPADDVKGDDETEIVDNAAEVFAGDSRRDVIGGVADVNCDVEEKQLSFVIVNTGEHVWDLDQTIGFGGEEGKINLQVFINNEEANSGIARYEDGERLFGPNEKFSDNCGGVTELAPGEEASCTLHPVPLREEGQYSNKNRIWLDLPGGDVEYVTFTCT